MFRVPASSASPQPIPHAAQRAGAPWRPVRPAPVPAVILAGFITRNGKQPFIHVDWVREKAAGLTERQRRLLDEALFRLKGEAQKITERNDGTLQFEYVSSNGSALKERSTVYDLLNSDCKVVLQLGRAAEVTGISITRQSDPGMLVIDKANRSTGRPQEPASARHYAASLREHPVTLAAQPGEIGALANALRLSAEEKAHIRGVDHSGQIMRELPMRYDALIAKGFSRQQILDVATASRGFGLAAMDERYDALALLHFTHAEIANIAAMGGRLALECLASASNYSALRTKGFQHAEIASVATRHGGAPALKALLATYDMLREKGCSHADLLTISRKAGGAQVLWALKETCGLLERLGFARQQIIRLAKTKGSAQVLREFGNLHPPMAEAGLSHDQIMSVATINNPLSRLQVLARYCRPLRQQGFTPAHIVGFASVRGAEEILETVSRCGASLRSKGLSHDQITRMSARPNAARTLALIASAAMQFQPWDLYVSDSGGRP